MSKRKYNKKSEYWKKFDKSQPLDNVMISNSAQWSPELSGEGFYQSIASQYTRSGKVDTQTRKNRAALGTKASKYENIHKGLLPYHFSAEGIHIREAIELCQKAYCNISIFRNAIDIMAEFANAEILLEGGSEVARSFIQKWFDKINLWFLKDQFFREYYRSGNVFLYTLEGKINLNDLRKSYRSEILGLKGKIPLRYIILNPYDIVRRHSSSFSDSLYEKILSEYEIERLKTPKNDLDRQIFESLSPDAKKKVNDNAYLRDGVKVPLDPKYLRYCFYKKQDYEPFAIPFGFPVLDDINFKLELKKIDQAITRTIENVILLITMGAEPDKGGVNPANMVAMQKLFQNESVGRVLVSDYTTKAQFVIPEINKVLGAEKYAIVNQDIKEGLQNIIVGQEKFSNTAVKAEIFLERLKESRNAFLKQFLQPEINQICKNLGMKSIPKAKFEEVNVKDETQLQRVTTRLMEIGILTPQQGVDVMKTGVFPDSKEISPAQEKFVEEREMGYYNPLVGGVPMIEGEGASETPQSAGRPAGTSGIPKESTSKETYGRTDIQNVVYATEQFSEEAKKILKTHKKIKRFNKSHQKLLSELCSKIIVSSETDNWHKDFEAIVKDSEKIMDLDTLPGINEICAEHQIEEYPAALLYHSKKIKNEKSV